MTVNSKAAGLTQTGFPRKLDQAEYFEERVAPIALLIVLECPETVLVERLILRCRKDDDADNIQRRIRTFQETTSQVLQKFEAKGKVVRVKSDEEVEKVFVRIQEVLKESGVLLQLR